MIQGTNAEGVLNAYQLSNLIVQSLKDAVHSTRQEKLSEPLISIVFPFFSPRKKKQIIVS